ncbi:ATP-dependent DNA helicase [Nephila pilipes]|uniref:ATP-dependent DNA helicase n=1 Tax=Nephila pilipes TaxID=299642 RepID=A0A8X6M7B4_NEPPI|nr:ATP-dependent DNA helicase [Nephila pilipes]
MTGFLSSRRSDKAMVEYRESLSEDIRRRMETESRNIEPVVDIVYNQCLIHLEDIVTSMSGKSLLHCGLPEPIREQNILINNRQYMSELTYDVPQLIQVVSVSVSKFNHDEKKVYVNVLNSFDYNSG